MSSEPFQQKSPIKIRLPLPYLSTYYLERTAEGKQSYRLRKDDSITEGKPFPKVLHADDLVFSKIPAVESDKIPDSDNREYARARRSPVWSLSWEKQAPTLSQTWMFLYTFFTYHFDVEQFRLRLEGAGAEDLAKELVLSMVAINMPPPPKGVEPAPSTGLEVLVLRSAFWQGCASPLGQQPIWLPTWNSANVVPHLEYVMTPTSESTLLRHPRRTPKPAAGSYIYSRYIPSLDEHFNLVALDYENPEHLGLFNTWQNDPRVAAGWMETGTLDEHRTYLKNIHDDPHQFAVLGYFNDTPFAYFELYWAKEDKMGQHYACLDFDRGRHSLVGNDKFRGQYRVMAWWPSVMHYEFLDDHRTENVVGEPRLSSENVLKYEMIFGLHQDKWMDLPHKRSNLVKISRERFFQICPFNQGKPRVAGTTFGFEPKL
ncbi:related to aerobactin siderophore biosynthesis protein iucB [Fusarium fujikuroi IMI 58289]|uniref:Related to aerobactin siderophore biosynthesis protein iucB n=1 Tax=Gibberella fujikuroi (strain CBS 195.34 / IMI 58289 / NRRL A-6831) TaxID=1279085 RepID=S0EP57_GIBF5|nr:related to aerobactin siderophore biosynthesis protein iucB [Fusarium fujikuroi IMI 58289]CCT74673.1 related to aerobactin siderophore biosynthesis protein iucB [Fusarium fujikuroi IMI 58289]SCO05140.1 related to aerobactin siderophore biosynthesis protein iucB [Fusarium fujikuroi]SCO57992.1 related to aerobactin siderophore biosynthesis protein iucB [Fusarium fujikuroi]